MRTNSNIFTRCCKARDLAITQVWQRLRGRPRKYKAIVKGRIGFTYVLTGGCEHGETDQCMEMRHHLWLVWEVHWPFLHWPWVESSEDGHKRKNLKRKAVINQVLNVLGWLLQGPWLYILRWWLWDLCTVLLPCVLWPFVCAVSCSLSLLQIQGPDFRAMGSFFSSLFTPFLFYTILCTSTVCSSKSAPPGRSLSCALPDDESTILTSRASSPLRCCHSVIQDRACFTSLIFSELLFLL